MVATVAPRNPYFDCHLRPLSPLGVVPVNSEPAGQTAMTESSGLPNSKVRPTATLPSLAVSAPPVQAKTGLLTVSKPAMASSAGKSREVFIEAKGTQRRARGKQDANTNTLCLFCSDGRSHYSAHTGRH